MFKDSLKDLVNFMNYHNKKPAEVYNDEKLFEKFDELFKDIDIEELNEITVKHWKDEIP